MGNPNTHRSLPDERRQTAARREPAGEAVDAVGEPHVAPISNTQPDATASYWQRLSINDWLVGGYLVALNVAWWLRAQRPWTDAPGRHVGLLLVVYVVLVFGIARRRARSDWVTALCYRVGHFSALQLSYLIFADFLPEVSPGSLDAELLQLDQYWFGGEPAQWFDGFVSQATTEWFSFFYFSYFFLLAAHIFPIVFFGRDRRIIAEFGLGLSLVAALGQICYVFVPGFGPYTMAHLFTQPLPDGVWWQAVTQLVHERGAQKDIFPSLHTALPTFILLFSVDNRRLYPYRYTWPLVALIVFNIVLATMFLRWHYLIDVVAGLVLAASAFLLSRRAVPWEIRRRSAVGAGAIWPTWSPARTQDPAA